jgi:glutamine synthetase
MNARPQDIFSGCTTADEAARALAESRTERVHIGIFDAEAAYREKSVAADKAQKMLHEGFSFSDVLYEWDIMERTYSGGAFADEPAEMDPTSGRVYPFAPNEALFVADFTGAHAGLSPRNLAKAQIDRAAAMGFGVRAGFEFEFFVFEETPQSLRDKGYRNLRSLAPGNRTYSLTTLAVENDFLTGLLRALAVAGIQCDCLHTELGPGCLEAPLAAREGLRACDDAALFRILTKTYALTRERMATFMAKWSNEWPGQSGHLHLSLFRLDDGSPVFANGSNEPAPAQSMRWFIGGLLEVMPEILVMSARTVNDYRRLVPGAWAPTHASWGVENRSCAVRAIPLPREAARIEFRVPAADSNPYLAMAACLAAGLTGLERRIDPPPPTEGDAYLETVSADLRFPRNLLEATERFRASAAARDMFGDDFVDWYCRTREWEDSLFRAHVSDLEVRRYFETV